MALLTDITEQRQLTEALIRSQKMEAVGQLTGGIAHDFNNILGSILGFAELAQARFGGREPKLHDYLLQIETAGARARDLIRQLLIFSRGENTQAAASVPLSPLIKEVVKMLRPMLPAAIEIRYELSEVSANVKVDPLHIQQLLMNLCINARDAIEGSGVITVQVVPRSLEGGLCAICGEAVSGDWIAIRVTDTGHGIEESLREDIFQPFITSKEVGEGSGMGLAVVRGIITSYNGHLLLESSPGRGASFEILLPEALPGLPAEESLAAHESTDIQLQGFTILAVDDELQFRTYYEELLGSAGAQVVCCESGIQALGRYQRNDRRFDLIISDQSMPGMSGLELVRHLRGLGCRTPVILCSGYGHEVDDSEMRQLQILELLHKPVSRSELLAAMRRGLAI
jgi:nitrogen-specific signal transduction histidine kinase/ActR/RegA family two-component response regulator